MSGGEGDEGSRRETIVQAMLDAAERLFSERGFTAVSVRDIAREAGISHALVHRYLGPKEDIYRAVLKRNEDVIRDAAGDTEDFDAALSLMVREGLANHRDYLRLIAHSALHGLPYEATMGRFRATERLVELAEMRAAGASGSRPDAVEPRVAVAAIVALYLGWVSLEPWMVRAAGLQDLGEETLAASLERIMLGIADTNLPVGD